MFVYKHTSHVNRTAVVHTGWEAAPRRASLTSNSRAKRAPLWTSPTLYCVCSWRGVLRINIDCLPRYVCLCKVHVYLDAHFSKAKLKNRQLRFKSLTYLRFWFCLTLLFFDLDSFENDVIPSEITCVFMLLNIILSKPNRPKILNMTSV